MHLHIAAAIVALLLAAVVLVLGACAREPTPEPGQANVAADALQGVVVEEVGSGAARAAGLQVGDTLLRWSRRSSGFGEDQSGLLSSPFDVWEAEHEQAPRGPVTLAVIKNGAHAQALMPRGSGECRRGRASHRHFAPTIREPSS